jgi:hypothetical protein
LIAMQSILCRSMCDPAVLAAWTPRDMATHLGHELKSTSVHVPIMRALHKCVRGIACSMWVGPRSIPGGTHTRRNAWAVAFARRRVLQLEDDFRTTEGFDWLQDIAFALTLYLGPNPAITSLLKTHRVCHAGLGMSCFIPNGSKDGLVARVLTLAIRLVPQEHEVRTKSGLWVVAAAQAPDMATFDGLKSIRHDLKEGTFGRLDAVVYSQACGCGRPRLALLQQLSCCNG